MQEKDWLKCFSLVNKHFYSYLVKIHQIFGLFAFRKEKGNFLMDPPPKIVFPYYYFFFEGIPNRLTELFLN